MANVRISALANVPMLYDRQIEGHYGVTGIPFRPFMHPTFAELCDACFNDLFQLFSNHGLTVSAILSGGVGRAGTGPSFHHQNRAFDLDGLVMVGGNWVANTFPQRPLMYLAIESVLRQHFGTVLSYDFNAAHEDHFHFDDGRMPGFKNLAKSHVIFLQNVIFFVYGIDIGIDGVWGPETNVRSRELRDELGIGPFSDLSNWQEFLRRVSNDALKLELAVFV